MQKAAAQQRKKVSLSQILIVVLCVLVCFITIYPMYYVLIRSISDPVQVSATGAPAFFPKGFYLGSYLLIVKDMRLWRALGNTIFYAIGCTVLMLLTTTCMAYPLTRPNLKFRKAVVFFVLLPMYFGGGLIPTFLLYTKLGLYNTVWAILLPSVSIWNIILAHTFFKSIPETISESAFIDGANHFQVMTKIIMPLSKPVFAVLAIYSIVGVWNDWFTAMIYLPNEDLHPLQMFLQRILIAQTVDLTQIKTAEEMKNAIERMLTASQLNYSMIIFVSVPIIMIYPMFQKYFIKGVMLGSLKE